MCVNNLPKVATQWNSGVLSGTGTAGRLLMSQILQESFANPQLHQLVLIRPRLALRCLGPLPCLRIEGHGHGHQGWISTRICLSHVGHTLQLVHP